MALQIRTHSFNPLPWFVILFLGVFLVALAAPGLISLYTAHSANRLVSDLAHSSNEHPRSEFEEAVKKIEAASEYEPGRRQYYTDQATLLLQLYYKQKSAGKKNEATVSLQLAGLAITRSLKLAPGDANLWYLLAEIRALQGKMDDKARRFLNMSYLSGAREGWVALRRLQFSLRYWLLLDNGLRRHVKREIRTLWFTPSYQRILVRQFSGNTARVQKIIFTQIKTYEEGEVQKFSKYARRAGWKLEF